ncbi:MAG: hypothetical protein IKF53_04750 [Clostridia bacterium]|nr:hypothetical protein [Clostridia bacterium]
MRYGESVFDIFYLVFAICSGIVILKKARNRPQKLMGLSAVILGLGDSFHLIPRVLNYFVDADFTAALGIGKLVTSLTMTVFYILLYYVYIGYYEVKENKRLTILLFVLLFSRFILCFLPQNGWLQNSSDTLFGIIRNIPFVIIGGIMVLLFFKHRKEKRTLKNVWIYILLSFLFYIPVAVAAGLLPILGMLMLPKTICYILLIVAFIKEVKTEKI